MPGPLVDTFGRVVRKLRLSVTDRCNFRCAYCMPMQVSWIPRAEVLSYEEMTRISRIAVTLGVQKIRITGGEPTARKDIPHLVAQLKDLPGLQGLSMTTNGYFLHELARPLREAGLRSLTVSLDTMDADRFHQLCRREALPQVLAGIEAAERAGFAPIKINTVVMRGVNEDEVGEFVRRSREGRWQVRFIEFMPLDGDHQWSRDKVVTADEMLAAARAIGPIEPLPGQDPSDPARVWRFTDGKGDFGIIASVTKPFCQSCDRIRVTADGKIRNCLFSTEEYDLKGPLRSGASDADLEAVLRDAVMRKKAGHLISLPGFQQPERAMYAIGG